MAYTKYSLTPANNNAAPPDGAPEGMLPSAVNDTMRDMMAQIRDCGDGIRGGTYTMTAPVITGGSISGVTALSTTGSLGVGVSSPVVKLDITGSGLDRFLVDTKTAGSGVVLSAVNNANSTYAPYTINGSINIFQTGATERMRIDASGNLNIGTTTAASGAQLTVNGAAVINQTQIAAASIEINANGTGNRDAYIDFHSDDTYTDYGLRLIRSSGANGAAQLNARGTGGLSISCQEATAITFATTNTERMRIDSSGYVLIGQSSHIWGSSGRGDLEINGSSASVLALNVGATSTNSSYLFNDAGSLSLNVVGSRYMSFVANSSERMRIASNGKLLIGATTAVGTELLRVAGTIAATGYFAKTNTTFSGNTFNINWSGSPQLWIDDTNIGTFAFTSDYRIKRNIETQTATALNRVMALRPVTYQMANYGDLFKESDAVKEGFIAHEVQEVIPSGADGVKDDENQIQSLRLDAILSVAVKAIQEQQAMIEELKAKVAALEAA